MEETITVDLGITAATNLLKALDACNETELADVKVTLSKQDCENLIADMHSAFIKRKDSEVWGTPEPRKTNA